MKQQHNLILKVLLLCYAKIRKNLYVSKQFIVASGLRMDR